jgi:putative transposase
VKSTGKTIAKTQERDAEELTCAMQLRVYPTSAQITVSGRWLNAKHRFRNEAVAFTQTIRKRRGAWFAQHPVLAQEWIPEEFNPSEVTQCSTWLTVRLGKARENVRRELGLCVGKGKLVEAVGKLVRSLTQGEIEAIEDAWLLTVPRTVFDQVLQDLDKTLRKARKDRKTAKARGTKYFNGRVAGFPCFKKWSYPGSIRLQVEASKNTEFRDHWQAGRVFVPGLGKLDFRDSGYTLPLTPPKLITVSRNAAGYWHISFRCAEGEGKAKIKQAIYQTTSLPMDPITGLPRCEALDVGISSRTTDTQGRKSTGRTRHLKRYQSRARGLQRGLSRKVKGSKRWVKRKNTLGRATVKLTNTRDAELRALAKEVVDNTAIICLEDLFLGFMLRNRNLAAAAHDAALGQLKTYIKREIEKQGKLLLECGKFYATTQTCSGCGYKNANLKNNLSIRTWTCPGCASEHERDHNGAINTRAMSLKKALATASENGVGILKALGVKHQLHPELKEFIVCGGLTALFEQYCTNERRLVSQDAKVLTEPAKRAQHPIKSNRAVGNGVGGFRC